MTDPPPPSSPARRWEWAWRSRAGCVADGVPVVGLDRERGGPGTRRAPSSATDSSRWWATSATGTTHERAADAAERRGPLRHWVNNAGIDIVGGAHEVTPEHIEQGLRVLQHGVMFGCAIAVRRMLPARTGSIVNISSIQGVAAWPRLLRLRRRQGGDPDGDQERRARLRPARPPLQRGPPGEHRHADVPGRDPGGSRRSATRGSRARPHWRRCCGSAGRRRSPTWWRSSCRIEPRS